MLDMNFKKQYEQNQMHRSNDEIMHNDIEHMLVEIFHTATNNSNMPGNENLKKAVNAIGKLVHNLFDYRHHNMVLIAENAELYRQIELQQQYCEDYVAEIAALKSDLAQITNKKTINGQISGSNLLNNKNVDIIPKKPGKNNSLKSGEV